MTAAAAPLDAPWSPDSLARRARPRSSPTGPTTARSTPRSRELARPAAARVRGRGPLADRVARRASPRARRFLLQAGDCAESFDAFSADAIRDKLKVILQMSVVLTYSTGVPTVKVGRIAGQFAKPRSSPTETPRRRRAAVVPRRHGQRLRVRRRGPPARPAAGCVRGYHQAASTLNLLRAFTKGGFADLSRVHAWNLEFVAASPEGRRYDAARRARSTGRCGSWRRAASTSTRSSQLHQVDFYTSHEALLLGYEEALTRRTASPATGTTARRTCSGSATAPASSTARTSSSSPGCRTRSA